MEFAYKEIHYYSTSQDFYEFDKSEYTEYKIISVEGYYADRWYRFTLDEDYELYNNGIRWLDSGKFPEPPPVSISTNGNIPFEITYLYEVTPVEAMSASVFPFMQTDGVYMTIIRAFGDEIQRIYEQKNGILREHDFNEADGTELEYMASWYNVTRSSGESDENLRGRLLEFLESYGSSGTIEAITSAVEAYTGTSPDIIELWQSVSYFNYNIDDYNDINLSPDQWRTYLFEGGNPDDVYTFQAYFYDPLFQLNTFFCILPYSVIIQYGLDNIKTIIQKAKAAGVQGYLGWLLDESFDNLDNWEVAF
ncbi:MAG: hypothetical protein GF411_02750 [Candidatus Lokiarchaeota archaeon]|nr:hypothetical protein [Candidatus Lokiarchaeota archaeon]